ncbi:DNA glycosylase [Geopyxis carbonaria]|nr:DNA glycosylase [Geopyxis carbonaria]
MTISVQTWNKLPISREELCLSTVLRCGQSFRWKSSGTEEWSCALNGRILSLKQDHTHLHYRAIFPASAPPKDDTLALVRDYLSLSINLSSLYKDWSQRDLNFSRKAPSFAGVRMLRQDPWENVVSFICSSNNNIARISQMVNNLCVCWGKNLGSIDGDGETYYDFPEPVALQGPDVEQKLRELGFGYRAKYIANAALLITNERSPGWLDSLREVSYREAHEALLELPGVGPKVADCVCLMSLDKTEAVPVDTHVWQIAQRDYNFAKVKNKTLTKATYNAVGDYFRELWGKEAGWAHSVLFAADLKAFKEVIPKTATIPKVQVKAESAPKFTAANKKRKLDLIKVNLIESKENLTSKVLKVELPLGQEPSFTTLAERVKGRRR